MDFDELLGACAGHPWAIRREAFDRIRHDVAAQRRGRRAIRRGGPAGNNARSGAMPAAGIAVLNLCGVLNPYLDCWPFATSILQFAQDFDRALPESSVGAIFCNIDSPGGSVSLIQETAKKILDARGQKPLIAIANAQAASAAFWIASAFDEFVVTPSGEAGSLGVLTSHVDHSKQNAMLGVEVTYVSAGPYKTEWNSDSPLSKEAFDFELKRVNEYYDAFVNGVARGRGVTAAAAKRDFGGGRCLSAKDCVRAGMADRVATFDSVLGDLSAAMNPQAPGYSPARRALLVKRLERLREARDAKRRPFDIAVLRKKLELRRAAM
jgi:capsid assembly protease